MVDGTYTQIGLVDPAPFLEAGDRFGVRKTGASIQIYVDTGTGWTQVGADITDSTYASGYIGAGMMAQGGVESMQFADFGGGTIGGGSGRLPVCRGGRVVAHAVGGVKRLGAGLAALVSTGRVEAKVGKVAPMAEIPAAPLQDAVSYTYGTQSSGCPEGALNKPHAVVTFGANTYCYDQNGNMRRRTTGGQTSTLSYDAENHLTGVSGAATANFVYDGDGNRVTATMGGATTVYIGNYAEWTDPSDVMTKYYYAGGKRVAMRVGSTLYYLLSDHLGSTTVTANSGAAEVGELRYRAWGETRYTSGTTYTARHFQGQLDESMLGLYFFNARWLDPLLGRFAQADSIIPDLGNPQAWDRYAFVYNNPLKYTDPSGHMICDLDGYCGTTAGLGERRKKEQENTGDSPFGTDLGGNIEHESEDQSLKQITSDEKVGLVITGGVLIVGLTAAEVSLAMLAVALPGYGPLGILADVGIGILKLFISLFLLPIPERFVIGPLLFIVALGIGYPIAYFSFQRRIQKHK